MSPEPPPDSCPDTPDAYVAAFHRQLGIEIARHREALGLSAYAVAKAAGVCDQTVLNLERGTCPNGCWTGTLTRIARRFGVRVTDLVTAAEARMGRD